MTCHRVFLHLCRVLILRLWIVTLKFVPPNGPLLRAGIRVVIVYAWMFHHIEEATLWHRWLTWFEI